MKPSTEEIEARLRGHFGEVLIQVQDDSHLHAGHAGAEGGAGHYTVRIISDRFEGLRPLARHRLVYDAVKDWMPGRIHALSIEARTPSEPR